MHTLLLGLVITAAVYALFVCALVAIAPGRSEHCGTGTLEGRIAEEPSGTAGFGFDPVFIPEGEEQVSLLGEKLMVDRIDGSASYTQAGRPIAVVSNFALEYQPGPPPRKKTR